MSIKRMFFDIETSPNIVYSWRTGYKIDLSFENIIKERAIVCVCWKWEGQKRINSLTWNNGNDKKLVAKFLEEMKKADECVAHNGAFFDIRWLKGQMAKYGLGDWGDVKVIDTYSLAKKHFYLNSYKLDYLAWIWFNKRKLPTSFELWIDVCNGSKSALDKMVQYCKGDVVLEEMVWSKLEPFCKSKCHAGVLKGLDRWSCPSCASEDVHKDKTRVTAAGIARHQMQCNSCRKYYTIPNLVYVDYQESKGD